MISNRAIRALTHIAEEVLISGGMVTNDDFQVSVHSKSPMYWHNREAAHGVDIHITDLWFAGRDGGLKPRERIALFALLSFSYERH